MPESFFEMSKALGYFPADVRTLSPLALAYLGDTVYDLYVRSYLVHVRPGTTNDLHKKASRLVCAASQASAYYRIEPFLDEEEAEIFRRGRNTHSATVPKNASVTDYRIATGIETLFGWLFSLGRDERIEYLMKIILTETDNVHENEQQ